MVFIMRDADLVADLADARGERRAVLVAMLGDAEGDEGPSYLRSVLSAEEMSSNLRCTALIALAKRCGEDATADFEAACGTRSLGVRDYGVLTLAAFGDDRAWQAMLARLARLRRRRRLDDPPSGAVLVTYLVRHSSSRERVVELVSTVRDVWGQLLPGEQRVIKRFWPDVAPNGPEVAQVRAPDALGMENWLRKRPVFGALV